MRATAADARAALAGAAAAAAWAAAEPLGRPLHGTSYSDVRLLGRPLSRRHWRAAGLAIHLANGAGAGVLFRRLGLRGPVAAVALFQAENLAAWPLMAVVDRLHPDRRSGAWPPLLRNRRVLAYEVAMHAVFGAVLGTLLRHEARRR
jgi:hypothetical protein